MASRVSEGFKSGNKTNGRTIFTRIRISALPERADFF
jgi:hypothetical protein